MLFRSENRGERRQECNLVPVFLPPADDGWGATCHCPKVDSKTPKNKKTSSEGTISADTDTEKHFE